MNNIIFFTGLFFTLLSNSLAQQFSMVADINNGIYDSNPSNFTELNGELLFTAINPNYGLCLYKSNGTTSGTVLVKDISQYSNTIGIILWQQLNSYSKIFKTTDGKIISTDGTFSGTNEIFNLDQYIPGATFASNIIVLNGLTYFIIREIDNVWGNISFKLCKVDNSFQNISVINQWLNSLPTTTNFLFENIGSYLMIGTYSQNGGTWSLDLNSNTLSQISFSNTLFCTNLYNSNYNLSKNYVKHNNEIFYTNCNNDLCKTNGTSSGTYIVIPNNNLLVQGSLTTFDNSIFFSGGNIGVGLTGIELYKTDGTLPNTNIVEDLYFGYGSSHPFQFTSDANGLYFLANKPPISLYYFDAISQTPQCLLQNLNYTYTYNGFPSIIFNNKYYFGNQTSNTSYKLWESNGTQVGTFETQNINPTSDSACINNFYKINNTLFFTACDSLHGVELWSSNTNYADINNIEIFNENVIFPNPSNGVFSIKNIEKFGDINSIFVKDVHGKNIKFLNPTDKQFNISDLNDGFYFLEITSNKKTRILKLNKEQ